MTRIGVVSTRVLCSWNMLIPVYNKRCACARGVRVCTCYVHVRVRRMRGDFSIQFSKL